MNRDEFMRQLEELLADVAEDEKREALEFYQGYFEDAGEENEERIIRELESPRKVAETIKEDLRAGNNSDTVEYTEHGYRDSRFEAKQEMGFRDRKTERQKEEDTVFQHGPRTEHHEKQTEGEEYGRNTQRESYQRNWEGQDNSRTWKILLVVVVAILTCPIWLTLAGGLLGLAGGLLGLIVSMIAVAGAFYISGVAVFGVGIGQIVTGAVGTGLALMGAGLLILTLAVLATIACVWIFGKLIPWIAYGIVRLCKSVFSGRGRTE